MKHKLLIIGAGDVGGFIAWNYDQFGYDFEKVGILDDDTGKIGQKINGWEVLGTISDIEKYLTNDLHVAIGIANPKTKKKIVQKLAVYNLKYPGFVSQNAWVSNGVKIGRGAIIYPGVSINHGTNVEDFALINMNCALGHDCQIGAYSFLSPGVSLGGFTKLEKGVQMGIGSTTKQSITIGEFARIGGQTMVLKDVNSGLTVVGVPAREL